jgi:hypothetical protein
MVDEIMGVAGFRCEDAGGRNLGTVYEDVSIMADWRASPSTVLAQFKEEAERLSRIDGRICGAQNYAFFNGDIRDYLISMPGRFVCSSGSDKHWVLHDVYTARIKDETPEETQQRLQTEAVQRHVGLVPLSCEGPVEFTGEFFEGGLLPGLPPQETAWERMWRKFGEFGAKNEHLLTNL